MKIINPATERVLKNLPEDDQHSIFEKYQLAKQTQTRLAAQSLEDRLIIVEKFCALLDKNLEKLAQVLTSEVGKPIAQSKNEIKGAQYRIQYFLENSQRILVDQEVFKDDQMGEIISSEPLGVIANISAWNYPYLVGVNVFIPAMIAGNTVLYKPSEYASLTGLEIQKLWNQAGLDQGVFQSVIGTGTTGSMLLDLPLDGYFFTGSYATGKKIYQKASEKMVPCQL